MDFASELKRLAQSDDTNKRKLNKTIRHLKQESQAAQVFRENGGGVESLLQISCKLHPTVDSQTLALIWAILANEDICYNKVQQPNLHCSVIDFFLFL